MILNKNFCTFEAAKYHKIKSLDPWLLALLFIIERSSRQNRQHHDTPRKTMTTSQQQQWHPQIHRRVRGELFKCLDQMSTLEKNFSDAQTEITRLRQYIKVNSETKILYKQFFD